MEDFEGLLATVEGLRQAIVGLPPELPQRTALLQLADRVGHDLARNAEAFPSRTSAVVRLGQVAAGMANDFNNVLMTILGNAEVALASLPGDARARSHLQEIAQAAQKGAQLTRQMLAALRTGAPVVGPVDLESLVRALISPIRALTPATTAVELLPGCDVPRVELDSGQVALGFQRLVQICRRDPRPRAGPGGPVHGRCRLRAGGPGAELGRRRPADRPVRLP